MSDLNKLKESYYNLYNNYNNEEDKESNENKNKKITLKKYKFHMLHHNGLFGTLKKNGININLVDNVYNKNESLFIELLSNKDQNDIKKSLLEINFQNNKININRNENETNVKNNTINIVK